LHQKQFEFDFTVDKLQGSLYKAGTTPNISDTLLAELVLESFNLVFYVRPYDMIAEIILKSMYVEDCIDTDGPVEFRRLVTSRPLKQDDQKSNSSEERNLVSITYAKVQTDSPEYMTVYDGIDQNVDVSLATINVIITQKSILTLLDFIITTFAPPSQDTETSLKEQGRDEKSTEIEPASIPVAGAAVLKNRVKVEMQSVILVLNDNGKRLATFTLDQAHIAVFLVGKTMRVGARLGTLSLTDDTRSQHHNLVHVEGDELADFRFETFDPEAGVSYPGYDSSLYLRLASAVIFFDEAPFHEILTFGANFARLKAIYDAAREKAFEQASQIQEGANTSHFDILIRAPIIIFPRNATTHSEDGLRATLGEVYASNTFVSSDTDGDDHEHHQANEIKFGIRNIMLATTFYHNDQAEKLDIIKDIDLDVNVLYREGSINSEFPELEES